MHGLSLVTAGRGYSPGALHQLRAQASSPGAERRLQSAWPPELWHPGSEHRPGCSRDMGSSWTRD